jgi:hypothetical protein
MGNFHSGGFQTAFQTVQEYFQSQHCKHCCNCFTSEGVQLVRQEPGALVVKVSCLSCGQPLGIAIVGLDKRPGMPMESTHKKDWSKKDYSRLADKPSISYDDVIEAHLFFSNLGSDWKKYLPAKKSSRNKVSG